MVYRGGCEESIAVELIAIVLRLEFVYICLEENKQQHMKCIVHGIFVKRFGISN